MISSSSSSTRAPCFFMLCNSQSQTNFNFNFNGDLRRRRRIAVITNMGRDRGKNRKQLQRGRNLSIEAIQTVQALKRAASSSTEMVHQVFQSKFNRLLKLDMLAVLKELLRQNEPLLAYQVFEDIRKEYWYKPEFLLYAEMIKVFASNNWIQKVELLLFYLKVEKNKLDADTEGFNALFESLMDYGLTKQAMECFQLMKEVQCEPNESTFRCLVNGLDSKGETDLSSMLREEAEDYFGWPLDCQEEEKEMILSRPKS